MSEKYLINNFTPNYKVLAAVVVSAELAEKSAKIFPFLSHLVS